MKNLFFVTLCCFLLTGCQSRRMPEEIRSALKANEMFYEQVSAEQYDAIYLGSSDELKAAEGRDSLETLLKRVRQKSRACGPAALSLTSYHLGGELVDLTYARRCGGTDEIRERFSWKIVNNRAVLKSYFANGSELTGD